MTIGLGPVGLLERTAVVIPEQPPTPPAEIEFAQKAKELLGYVALTEKVQQAEIMQYPLGRALNRIGIRPFTPESVKRYQEEILKIKGRDIIRRSLGKTAFYLAFFVVLASFGPATLGWVGSWLASSDVWYVSIGVLLCSSGVVVYTHFRTPWTVVDPKASWEWKRVSLDDKYSAPIPESVLQTAIAIKEEYPDVRFYIYQLERKDTKRAFDPFLVAFRGWGTEEYFVSVWDEPRFKAEQIA